MGVNSYNPSKEGSNREGTAAGCKYNVQVQKRSINVQYNGEGDGWLKRWGGRTGGGRQAIGAVQLG